MKTGTKPAVTLINRLDYAEDTMSSRSIDLALENAAGRLRRALSTSLREINARTKARLRKAS